ncbi:MAG: hypothetical protein ACKODX_04275 [Gemmata sp.]
MAIEFNCPHCAHAYKLKDELAGKTATCKTCRNKIVIPQPVAVPTEPRRATAEELAEAEAAAQRALADEPARQEDQGPQLIPVECPHCDHKWTEPIARAGKNTLCPNPECRQRIKIPEPKDTNSEDWRVQKTKLPSLAKGANEKLEGVQDAADVQRVSTETFREKILEEELEPRPLKQIVLFAVLVLGLVGGLVYGTAYLFRARTEGKENRLISDAQEEFAKTTGALPPGDAPPEAPLLAAILFTAGAEHALRHDDPKKLKDAQKQFTDARDAVRKAQPTPARNAVAAELAVALLALGGTEQQARDQLRIRWFPTADLKTRPNERVYTVLDELRQTLALLQGAEFEFKNHLARRLARELFKREQAQLAAELIPVALFGAAEQDEAKALVALELYRADKGSELAREAAEDLKGRGADLIKGVPTPASAQTLFLALDTQQAPRVAAPPTSNPVADPARFAYCGKALLDNQADEALNLARRPGPLEGQVRALVLCADWGTDPTAALDAAYGVVSANRAKKEVSPYAVLRLAQIAAEKGKHEQARMFADAIPDDGLRAWAKGSAVQLRIAASPKDKADEAWAEPPGDRPKEFRAGQAWGRMWVARQNARVSGSRSAEVKVVSDWSAAVVPFGKAGIALGLQDR